MARNKETAAAMKGADTIREDGERRSKRAAEAEAKRIALEEAEADLAEAEAEAAESGAALAEAIAPKKKKKAAKGKPYGGDPSDDKDSDAEIEKKYS